MPLYDIITTELVGTEVRKNGYYHEQSSISNLSVTSPTSQLILQPFRRFTYVTAHSPTLPLLHLRHSSFFNPSFASPTSQALYLIHLANRPWLLEIKSTVDPYLSRLAVVGELARKARGLGSSPDPG